MCVCDCSQTDVFVGSKGSTVICFIYITKRRVSFTRCSSLLLVLLAEGSVAIHHIQFDMTVGHQLLFLDVVLGSEHLTDLHKGFVLGLGNNEDSVDGHGQADRTEDQVTIRT